MTGHPFPVTLVPGFPSKVASVANLPKKLPSHPKSTDCDKGPPQGSCGAQKFPKDNQLEREDFDQLKERVESICTTTGNKGNPIQQVQVSLTSPLNYGYTLEENLVNHVKNSMTSQRPVTPVTSSPSWGRVRHNRL